MKTYPQNSTKLKAHNVWAAAAILLFLGLLKYFIW